MTDVVDDAASAPSPVVLVADDEASIRAICREILELNGYQVVEAVDGQACLRTFAAHPDRYDVLLLDLSMPGVDGLDAVAQIRAIRADAPIVIFSGYAAPGIANYTGVGPPPCFLRKPFHLTDLVHAIRTARGQV